MTRATSTIRVVSPTRARTSSPGDTMVDGLAGRSLTRTCPPRHAAAASGRVFVSRTAHNHRSTRVDSITSIMDEWFASDFAAEIGVRNYPRLAVFSGDLRGA